MNTRGKILIADDDELFLRTTAAVLEKAGHGCVCVESAAGVQEVVRREQIDVLITDIKMPGNAHLEMLAGLPGSRAQLPIIVVTGYPSLDTALAALQLRVVAYLVKPFAVEQLLQEVHRAMAQAELQRRLSALRQRWCAWAEELRENAALTEPEALADPCTLDTLLRISLQNLSHCVAEVQALRHALSVNASPVGCASALPRALCGAPAAQRLQRGNGGAPMLSPVGGREVLSLPDPLQAELQQLTRREREVLQLLLTNHKPQRIAKKLFISLHTVRNHLRSIFEKLAVHSQTELLTRLGRYMPYADWQEVV